MYITGIINIAKSISAILICLSLGIFNTTIAHGKKNRKDTDRNTPVQDYYRALYQYASSNISAALKAFEAIDATYPTFFYNQQSKVMIIYLQYLNRAYADAKQSIDNFTVLYPNSKYQAYLSYMRALCTFRQITGISKAYGTTIEANLEMMNVARQYKNTVYGKTAKQKHIYLENLITYDNYLVAQFYHKDRSYISAIKRYLFVIQREILRDSVNFLPLAYFRLSECYYDLGLYDLSYKYEEKFKEIIKDFNGTISFDIEGVINYVPEQEKEEIAREKAEKKAKKELKKQKKAERKAATRQRETEKRAATRQRKQESTISTTNSTPHLDIKKNS